MREYNACSETTYSEIIFDSLILNSLIQNCIMENNWWVEESNEHGYQIKSEFADAMKLRTKKLVLRHIKLFQALPKSEEANIIGKQLLAQRLPLAQTTALPAEQGVKPSFSLSYQSLLRKQMNLCFGWKFWKKQKSSRKRNSPPSKQKHWKF